MPNPRVRFKREDGTDYPEWKEIKLENAVDFLDEKRKPITSKYRKKGQYPYYGASGIIDYIFDEELVLLSEDGANIVDRNYRVSFIATGKYWVNNHAHCLRVKKGFSHYFLSEALENIDYTIYNTGSAQPKLNQEVCRNLPLICPNFEEQQKIADFLSTVDEVIAQSEQEVQNLEQQKKAAMQKIFSQEVRFKREDRTDYPEWEERELSYCFEPRDTKQVPTDDAPLMAFIAYQGVADKGDRYDRSYLVKTEDKKYKRTEYNDFIYSSNNLDVGSIGLNKYGTAVISVVYEIFQVKETAVPDFINALVQTPENMYKIIQYRQGCLYGQYKIFADDFLSVKTEIPCIQEQQKIADFLSAYDEAITYAKQELDKWKQLKKGLLQQMFV